MKADVWFEPKVVMEVVASEITVSPVHTCGEGMTGRGGLALRFPRFTGRWRTDKSPEDATTSEEVYDMYVRSLESRKKGGTRLPDASD
jgi:DNA ligase-1